MIHLKTPEEIGVIARGGAIIADFLVEVRSRIRPGVSTLEVDGFADEFIRAHAGAVPAFKGLYGFPGSVCVSLNEEVVHGIPKADRILEDGDIVSIDVGVKLDGWCSDSAWTFPVGEIDESTRHLMEVTEESLDRAVSAAVLEGTVGDIGAAVVTRVEGTGLGIIRDLVGHGVGREVHEEPQVPNFGVSGTGPALREGMVLAIEPMLSCGDVRDSDARRWLDGGYAGWDSGGPLRAHGGRNLGWPPNSHSGASGGPGVTTADRVCR